MRIYFWILILLSLGFMLVDSCLKRRVDVLPVFLKTDTIALNHQTDIFVYSHCIYNPDSLGIAILKTDYSNIWAHLNHLYTTNDVEAGKEYYTEAWFNQLCLQTPEKFAIPITRADTHHELHLQTWAWDGLACTAIDSNVNLVYHYPNNKTVYTTNNIAVVLLIQGDHWRIDALRVLNH